MSEPFTRFLSTDDLILFDETGLVSGRWDDLRLKSAYRPIYARQGESLAPAAVAASTIPTRRGAPLAAAEMDVLEGVRQGRFDRLSLALHLLNIEILDAPSLRLFVHLHPQSLSRDIPFAHDIEQLLAQVDLAPPALVVSLSAADIDIARDAWLAAEIRTLGAGVALDGFYPDERSLAVMRAFSPSVVELGSGFFGALADMPAGRRLLSSLVGRLRDDGASVHASDIASARHLERAVAAGAELLSGDLLGGVRRAGELVSYEPIALNRIREPSEPIPLSRSWR